MPKPNPIDIHVGSRIRLRRSVLKMSQEKLADQLGITFQQVQKYENGSNRVGASRLYAIAQYLSVEVPYFYEGYEEGNPTPQKVVDESTLQAETALEVRALKVLRKLSTKKQKALIEYLEVENK